MSKVRFWALRVALFCFAALFSAQMSAAWARQPSRPVGQASNGSPALEAAERVYKEADAARERGDKAAALQGYDAAFKQLTPLANRGNARAEALLARMYLMGYGVLKDPSEANKLFKEAARQGDATAQFFLAAPSILHHQNVAQGMMWLKLSAEQGNQDAQLLLGETYLKGIQGFVPPNYVMADMWLRLAAKDNLPFYKVQLMDAERRMNAGTIARGKALAESWKPKHGLKPPANPGS